MEVGFFNNITIAIMSVLVFFYYSVDSNSIPIPELYLSVGLLAQFP